MADATDSHPSAGPETPSDLSAHPVGHDGIRVDIEETSAPAIGGAAAFIGLILALALTLAGVASEIGAGLAADAGRSPALLVVAGTVILVVGLIVLSSVKIVAPGQTAVRQFFGRYIGTVRRTGLVLVTPLSNGRKVSVKVRNFETNELKVNDLDGNPIDIAAIVVWQVADTARAVFAVEHYDEFIQTQSEAALRHVATTHPYDEPGPGETSLRGGTEIVSAELAIEVAERVAIAGLEIVEVRISSLSYAPEIAQAMLQRQQAGAIIDAREQIVEGAVTMVDQALTRLEKEDIVALDDERRAQMVSNLLVVLCSDQRTTPVVNTGSLYA